MDSNLRPCPSRAKQRSKTNDAIGLRLNVQGHVGGGGVARSLAGVTPRHLGPPSLGGGTDTAEDHSMTALSRWRRTGRLLVPCFVHEVATHIHGRIGVANLAWLRGASTAPGLAVMIETGIGGLVVPAAALWLPPADGPFSSQGRQVDP